VRPLSCIVQGLELPVQQTNDAVSGAKTMERGSDVPPFECSGVSDSHTPLGRP